MDELGWTIGVAQTEPHDPGEVMRDMTDCDQQAATRKAATAPLLTAEQEGIIADQAPSAARALPYQQRPNEVRMLVHCLQEGGYKIVPWVRANPR
jgi:hypothetical protein